LGEKFADDPQYAFDGEGQMKPEQSESRGSNAKVAKRKAERDILKNPRLTSKESA
jgi:transposase